jgi:hypothetical protein
MFSMAAKINQQMVLEMGFVRHEAIAHVVDVFNFDGGIIFEIFAQARNKNVEAAAGKVMIVAPDF